MEGFTKVGNTNDFKERRPHNVRVEGIDLVVVRTERSIVAFENSCPHQHSTVLHQGIIDDQCITCPVHGWTFDLHSGDATNGNGRLRMLEVKAVEGEVWVQNPAPTPSFTLFD